MADNFENPMRPKLGSSTLYLPITFDYSGGRKDSSKSKKLWSVIILVVGIIVGLGIMFNKNGFFLTNFLYGVVFIYLVVFFIRFVMLGEGRLRREYIEIQNADYKMRDADIWGIFSVEDEYPYFCRFRNGTSGVFIRFNKDVILGKYSEAEYEHYEAIGDAYNIAGASRISMCHIDYMDNVGTDERLEESFYELGRVSNPDVRDVLTDCLTYQQEQMLERVATFDVYLFTWTGSDISAWNTVQRILSCFLDANYRSFHVLNRSELRELEKVLHNRHDFSVNNAMVDAFSIEGFEGIVPISIVHEGVETKLGKTIEEKNYERELFEREQEAKKEELKRRKSRKHRKVEDDEEELDIF